MRLHFYISKLYCDIFTFFVRRKSQKICLLKVDPFLLAHPVYYKPVCIQFPTSADNMTLLTFAAERHVAAALGGRCC